MRIAGIEVRRNAAAETGYRGPQWAVMLAPSGKAQVAQALGEAGELSADMLRRLQPGRALDEATRAIRHRPRFFLDERWAEAAQELLTRATTGNATRQAVIAATAARYAAAIKSGDPKPVAAVASELGLRPEQVRDRLYKARVIGLLTRPTGRGRAGGTLTQAAIDLLKTEGSR